mmetsp:Transcript_11609/g.25852  ORF Transcript_11609/g.25852 Transcript_11609/m.25852 type:complete len:288 (+) Transcript_11609:110-973(+)
MSTPSSSDAGGAGGRGAPACASLSLDLCAKAGSAAVGGSGGIGALGGLAVAGVLEPLLCSCTPPTASSTAGMGGASSLSAPLSSPSFSVSFSASPPSVCAEIRASCVLPHRSATSCHMSALEGCAGPSRSRSASASACCCLSLRSLKGLLSGPQRASRISRSWADSGTCTTASPEKGLNSPPRTSCTSGLSRAGSPRASRSAASCRLLSSLPLRTICSKARKFRSSASSFSLRMSFTSARSASSAPSAVAPPSSARAQAVVRLRSSSNTGLSSRYLRNLQRATTVLR